jgi:hypothetical protein
MDPLIIPIVAIVFTMPIIAYVVRLAHKHQLAKLELEARKHTAVNTGATAEQVELIRELQDRVQVLERIVTDGGYDLATRIEALRDQRPMPSALETHLEAERLG